MSLAQVTSLWVIVMPQRWRNVNSRVLLYQEELEDNCTQCIMVEITGESLPKSPATLSIPSS